MNAEDIDDDTLAEAEKEARESRPRESAMWDERLYLTHFPVLSWAERGDDLLAESNYLMALEALQGAEVHDVRVRVAGNDERAGDDDETDVIDATIGDWLVGSLRQIFVRSRAVVDDTFTGAWREAVSIAQALRDYPVLDDSDFSEREWKAFETDADNALEHARHENDSDADFAAYVSIVWDVASDDGFEEHGDDYASANWEAFQEQYELARNGVLLARATLAYQTLNERDEIPGQLSPIRRGDFMKRRTFLAILAGLIAAPVVTLGIAFMAGGTDTQPAPVRPVAATSAVPVAPVPTPVCDGHGPDGAFCYLDFPAGEWLFYSDAAGTVTPVWQTYPAPEFTVHPSIVASTD